MNRLSVRSCVAMSILLLEGVRSEAGTEEVFFGDVNLEAAVRAKLGIDPPAPVTAENMLTLTGRFTARSKGITSFEGIQYAQNVTELECQGNPITDIRALAHMQQLTFLDLNSTEVDDLSPLSNMPHLSYVGVLDANVVDVTPLGTIGRLATNVSLELSHNTITDLSPLKDISDWYMLYAYGNDIEDISCLSDFGRIWLLDLSNNRISDISVFRTTVADMGAVSLGLGGNQIRDVSPLAELDLRSSHVSLRDNRIRDVSPLAGERFEGLDLRDNEISDISSLNTIIVRSYLDLRGNPLNREAYETYIPMIQAANPDVDIRYDPIPEPAAIGLLSLIAPALLRVRRKA